MSCSYLYEHCVSSLVQSLVSVQHAAVWGKLQLSRQSSDVFSVVFRKRGIPFLRPFSHYVEAMNRPLGRDEGFQVG